ncbi:MAG: hypothetical protein SO006_08815 [Muribaculaceae bacterium]|nr:hypothetical protein [Muribaculaceae bacterium]
MKKHILSCAAAALLTLTACGNKDGKPADGESWGSEKEVVTEQPAGPSAEETTAASVAETASANPAAEEDTLTADTAENPAAESDPAAIDKLISDFEKGITHCEGLLKGLSNNDPTAMMEFAATSAELTDIGRRLEASTAAMTPAQQNRFKRLLAKADNLAAKLKK